MSVLSDLLLARAVKTEEHVAALNKYQLIKEEIDKIDIKITEVLKDVPDNTFITIDETLHRVRRNSFNMIVLERIQVLHF